MHRRIIHILLFFYITLNNQFSLGYVGLCFYGPNMHFKQKNIKKHKKTFSDINALSKDFR